MISFQFYTLKELIDNLIYGETKTLIWTQPRPTSKLLCLTLFALGGAQCALAAEIALKTQKNEKKFLKKVQICPTHHPPRSSPSPPFYSMYRDA